MSGVVKVGDRLVHRCFPPISRHTLAVYCSASGDLNPIHVDSDAAQAAGFPDVFAQGMLVMAYLGEAVTAVVKQSRLRSFSTRFVAITPVGATLTAHGEVSEIFAATGETRARLMLTLSDEHGDSKLAGEAVVAL